MKLLLGKKRVVKIEQPTEESLKKQKEEILKKRRPKKIKKK